MVLGKRHGSPIIKRTSSMTLITLHDASQPSDHHPHQTAMINPRAPLITPYDYINYNNYNNNVFVMDYFLKTCSFCNRDLCHHRDIFMYRGDKAFCSLECREKQMVMDEKKVNNGVVSSKNINQSLFT